MRLLCPNCRESIDAETLTCTNQHRFTRDANGVLILLSTAFDRVLSAFLSDLHLARAADRKRILDPTVYRYLPDIPATIGDAQFQMEWRLRRDDWQVIDRLLRGRSGLRVLDIGAWNGWLSHRLAQLGHAVIGIDYFVDEYDGLGARRFYSIDWQAVQIDLIDLNVIDEAFDVVILNRGLQFFPDPLAYIVTVQQKVARGGCLIVTGLPFFRDTRSKVQQVAKARRAFQDCYGRDLFLRPTKGYLDFSDRQQLQSIGLELKRYPQLWRADLKAWLKPTAPTHRYGLWRRGAASP
ncbi:MAG TPA: methyltransferase domain-containing protein [Anaerolineae bacterium]|nr:methyltransferase domain-containing protein [Anaerolineae bacterium]